MEALGRGAVAALEGLALGLVGQQDLGPRLGSEDRALEGDQGAVAWRQPVERAVAAAGAGLIAAVADVVEVETRDPTQALVSTRGLEKEINTSFRLHSPTVIARLREAFPDLPEEPDEETVFVKLRELRNSW